jgi:hypothetical protein
VDRSLLEEVLGEVPDQWLELSDSADSPRAVRTAYVEFLLARVRGSRPWLPVVSAA